MQNYNRELGDLAKMMVSNGEHNYHWSNIQCTWNIFLLIENFWKIWQQNIAKMGNLLLDASSTSNCPFQIIIQMYGGKI